VRLAARTRQAVLALLLAAPLATAQDILADVGLPREAPQRGVLDLGGMLSDSARAELEDLAMRYKTGSGHEVLLVTVPTLKQRAIEDVARRIGRDWKLGAKDLNDAAVLLLARDEHDVRIEVGRGLEGTLTDAVSSRIIRNIIVPHFQEGDFDGGTIEGVKAIHAAAGGDYADIPEDRPVGQTLPPLLAMGIILLIVVLMIVARRGGRGGRGGRRGRVMPFPFPLVLGGGGGGFGGGGFGGGGGGGGFGGFGGGGGGFSGGGASGHW